MSALCSSRLFFQKFLYKFMRRLFHWYFELCKQTSLSLRESERKDPKIWQKDFVVLRFINQSVQSALAKYSLRGKAVLDLGCSHKPYSALFQAAEYHGVDYAASEFVDTVADLNTVLDLHRQFDLVVSFDTFEHILNTGTLLETISLNLKEGGYVFISSPFFFGIHDAPHDYHRFTEYFYRNLPSQTLRLESIKNSTTYPASILVLINSFIYRLPIFYFLKYPFYAVVNVISLAVDGLIRAIIKPGSGWLAAFIYSAPLEYFSVFKKQSQ
jgi:SAM-dependent methyltransferase